MTTYKRIITTGIGPARDVFRLVEAPIPQPGPGQIGVRVLAAGVSFADIHARIGQIPGPENEPLTPGIEIVGIVDQLGDRVTRLEAGQTVAALIDYGGYGEYVCFDAVRAVPVPPNVNPCDAVAVTANGLAAVQLLKRAVEVQPGSRVLVYSAAGGVGTLLLQLGQQRGLEVYGAASAAKHDLVRSLGATPIDYRTENVIEHVRELGGVDAVFDPFGGWHSLKAYRALRPGGTIIMYGTKGGLNQNDHQIELGFMTALRLNKLGSCKVAIYQGQPGSDEYREDLAEALQRVADGKLRPVIDTCLPLEDAAKAHDLLESGATQGKIVLVVDEKAVC